MSRESEDDAKAYRLRYERWTRPFAGKPRRVALLASANKLLTGLFYGAFGVLLLVVGCEEPVRLVPLVGVLGAAFALVSLGRRRFNAPRPYECSGIVPLVAREGKGSSFPSRHTFSAFAIATSWLAAALPPSAASPAVDSLLPSSVPAALASVGAAAVPVAAGLLACAAALAWCRVIGGVHFPCDVAAGAALGLAAGLVATALALPL